MVPAAAAATHANGAPFPTAAEAALPDAPSDAPPEARLTAATLEYWRDFIRPKERDLKWQRIGWRPSLWQGVLDAHEERKPVLLWVMNGHPMGST